MSDPNLQVLSNTALPTIGNCKVWSYDLDQLRNINLANYSSSLTDGAKNIAYGVSYGGIIENIGSGTITFGQINNLVTSITTNSKAQTINHGPRLASAYNNQFDTLIKEKQNTSQITTLVTTSVIKDIYERIGECLRTVYSAEKLVYTGFKNTSFDYEKDIIRETNLTTGDGYTSTNTKTSLSDNIKNAYQSFFGKNEVLNVYELQTPFNSTRPGSEATNITTEVSFPKNRHGQLNWYGVHTSNDSWIFDNGIEHRRILFSSHGLNENPTSEFFGKTFHQLATVESKLNRIVEGKPLYEYARDFGLEVITNSKMLNKFSQNQQLNNDRTLSSGFFITRDNWQNITGLIFYVTLIIPRPYMSYEAPFNKQVYSELDLTSNVEYLNADSIIDELNNKPNSNHNKNQRKQYIAISSRFNLFDLVQYYPIRQNIVDSNLITILGSTFNTLNNTKTNSTYDGTSTNIDFGFSSTDDKWELGLPETYSKLKCIQSLTYTQWAGKLISDCKLPEHTNIDYSAYIYRIIKSINRQFEITSLVNNQKIICVEELGNDKYIVMINIIIAETTLNGKTTRTYSFQMKEIQYNNLFPATILNSDVEISGELTVKNISKGLELMKIDPIKNTTSFLTTVGINQPSYEINSYLDINNLSRSKLTSFIEKLIPTITNSINHADSLKKNNVTTNIINKIRSVDSNDLVVIIPLKQYKSLTITPTILDRASRMNIFTAKLEGPFIVLAIQRVKTQILEVTAKIATNNTMIEKLYKEYNYWDNVETWIVIAEIALIIIVTVVTAGSATAAVSIGTKILLETLVPWIVEKTLELIDFEKIAKNHVAKINRSFDGIDKDEHDSATKFINAMISIVRTNTRELYLEIDSLNTELQELEDRFEAFNDILYPSSKKSQITTVQEQINLYNEELARLKQEEKFLIYIAKNEHIVSTLHNVSPFLNIRYMSRQDVSGIIMGPNLQDLTIVDSTYNETTTNPWLTDSTSLSVFNNQYIQHMPSYIFGSDGTSLIANNNKITLQTMYDYVTGSNGRNISSLRADEDNTPVLSYIRDNYLPWLKKEIETNQDTTKNLINDNLQETFAVPDNSERIAILNNRRTVLESSLHSNQDTMTYLTLFRNSAKAFYFSSMGYHHYLSSYYDWFDPRLTDGIYEDRFTRDTGGSYQSYYIGGLGLGPSGLRTSKNLWRFKAKEFGDTYCPNGTFHKETELNDASRTVTLNTNELNSVNEELAELNTDELQQYTKQFGFINESHNVIRNIINNIWQLYVHNNYNAKAKNMNYTIYTNLLNVDSSYMYIINASILFAHDSNNPSISLTYSYYNTDNYINDLSYRTKFNDIVNELRGTSELINYAHVILNTNLNSILNTRTTTISEKIINDNLFPNRFDCNSFITIDNITDEKVVCDEVNTHWKNQSFDNIYIPGTNDTTLSDVYDELVKSLLKQYEDIKYDYTYLVEYVVNNVIKLAMVRYVAVFTDYTGTSSNPTINSCRIYRITSHIDVNSIIIRGMSINGDANIDGNFYINSDNDTRDNMLTIDVYNKTFTNNLKIGIGKTPTTLLDITDTTLSKIVKLETNLSNSLYILNDIVVYGRLRNHIAIINKINEHINSRPDIQCYFTLHELPMDYTITSITGKISYRSAENIKVLYYRRNSDWEGKTYGQIMTMYPSSRDYIETYILPAYQKILDEQLLYNRAICTTTINLKDDIEIEHHRILHKEILKEDDMPVPSIMISAGNKVSEYNIDPTNSSTINNIAEYTTKQNRFMNYVKRLNNQTNMIRDESGNEIDSVNIEKVKNNIDNDYLTNRTIYDDITIYKLAVGTDPTASHVKSINELRSDICNNYVGVKVDYTKQVPTPDVSGTYVNTQIDSLTYTNRREIEISFMEKLLQMYGNNSITNDDTGMIIYKVGDTYYRSLYHVIVIGGVKYVYSFYMKYSDYIHSNMVSINSDTRMEGKLSIINEYTNTSHVLIHPMNKYVGVNTDQMVINYTDRYATTSSLYNASHNLVVYNDRYPNAVFARLCESETDTTYKYLGSHSGLTIQRTSGLHVFDSDTVVNGSNFMTKVGNNNETNHGITGGLITYDNWKNYKHYGADISFELRNRNGMTKELGQVKMVIDRIYDNKIYTGFGVQVVDNTVVSENIEDKLKNLMYVNSDRQLFVDGVVLGGKLLKVDASGNLIWGDTIIVASP